MPCGRSSTTRCSASNDHSWSLLKLREFLQKGNGRLVKWETGLMRWNVQILPGDRAIMETPPKEKSTIHGFQEEGFHGPII